MKKIANPTSDAEPALSQYGALCFRRSPKGKVRVLLVTSRDTGRWVLPKGWPMRDRTGGECALTEAFEEAGVFGRLIDRCIGYYSYRKVLSSKSDVPCVVAVYPVAVLSLRDRFPESDERSRKWFLPAEAAEKVAEPELQEILRRFDPDTCEGPGVAG